ncbi:MAG: PASTA domain-containing protein [Actinomycetia bacterium]|nr:PASTA domain-containing protein [Actinomycetes bacterium]
MFNRPPLLLRRRAFLAWAGLTAFDLLLFGRAVFIEAGMADRLRAAAEAMHLRGVPLAPLRGPIVDREGKVLAESYHRYSAYAVPVQVARPSEEARILALLLGLPAETIRRRLTRRLGFVWIKRRLTDAETQALRTQAGALPGVFLAPESQRLYPHGEFGGLVLGFCGVDEQGLAGLEYTYNRAIAGTRGYVLREYDVAGLPVPHAASHLDPPKPGNTLVTTLDANIQGMAERAAEEARLEHGAKQVMVTVMDPRTGGILALAVRPGLDPNRYQDVPASRWRDPVVSDTMPPGSIFKPVTLAAALATGATRPGAGFFCPGFKVVLGRRVNCWRRGGHGAESLSDVVKNSCNVGFMELGLALGLDRFYDALSRFRALGPTGVDLPGEARGILPAKSRATALDLAVMAFGQTLTTTPVAILNAIAMVANGGRLNRPHVGDRILAPDGRLVRSVAPPPGAAVIPAHVAELVQQMMTRVVREGTGKLAQVPGYRVAGKTGTAQKVVGGRVAEGTYIASFVGFAPVPDPRVAVLVSVDEPQGAYYGGQVAAPVVGRLLRQILEYLGVPPQEAVRPPAPGTPALVPNLVNLSPAEAERDARDFGFAVRFSGSGPIVIDQSVEYGGYRPAGSTIFLTLGDHPRIYLDWVAVPSVVGLPVADARRVAFDIGLNLHVEGNLNGRVTWQAWPPNREVRAGQTMAVRAR